MRQSHPHQRQGEAFKHHAENEDVQFGFAVLPVCAIHGHDQLLVGQQGQEQLEEDVMIELGVMQTALDSAQLVGGAVCPGRWREGRACLVERA